MDKLNLKFLTRAHTMIGLFSVFLFYISTYFGSLTLFLPYISVWESPSRHFEVSKDYAYNIDTVLDQLIHEHSLSTQNIEITLPSFRDPALKIAVENEQSIYLNPNNNAVIDTVNEYHTISNFFNDLHTANVIPVIGMPLMGLASTAMLFLMISGIMLYWYKRKQRMANQPHKNQRAFWFRWHKDLGLILVPYVIIFALSGAFLGLMLSTAHPFALGTTEFKESEMRKLVRPILFAQQKPLDPTQKKADMLPLSQLVSKANDYYPALHIQKINWHNYGKENAQIVFTGYLDDNKALSGRINRIDMTLSSASGELIRKQELEQSHGIKKMMSLFYYLHFLPDETLGLRLLFLIFGIGFGLALVLGYLIWAEKKMADDHSFSMMNRFSAALFIGVFPTSALVLWMYWFLPIELYDRDVWIRGSFFIAWFLILLYTVYQDSFIRVIRTLMLFTSWLLVLSVFWHGLITKTFTWVSYADSQQTIFYTDVTLLGFSALAYLIYRFVPKSALLLRYEYKGV